MDQLLRVREINDAATGDLIKRQFLYEVNAGAESAPVFEQFVIEVPVESAPNIEDARTLADSRASTEKTVAIERNAHPPVDDFGNTGEVTL
jgi:hypothetical protein